MRSVLICATSFCRCLTWARDRSFRIMYYFKLRHFCFKKAWEYCGAEAATTVAAIGAVGLLPTRWWHCWLVGRTAAEPTPVVAGGPPMAASQLFSPWFLFFPTMYHCLCTTTMAAAAWVMHCKHSILLCTIQHVVRGALVMVLPYHL